VGQSIGPNVNFLVEAMVSTIPETRTVVQPVVMRKRYVGEVVYLYAFDVAYDMAREPVPELLGQRIEALEIGKDKRTPRHPFLFKPQMVRLPMVERTSPHG